jgi:hypothetical protein
LVIAALKSGGAKRRLASESPQMETPMRHIQIAILAATLAAGLGFDAAQAAPCRNAAGKFIACPTAAASTGQRCRSASGAFAKCGTPGAKPVTLAAKTTTTANTKTAAKAKTTKVH